MVLAAALQTVADVADDAGVLVGGQALLTVETDDLAGVDVAEAAGSAVIDTAVGGLTQPVVQGVQRVDALSAVGRVVLVATHAVYVRTDGTDAVGTYPEGGVAAGTAGQVARAAQTVRVLAGETLTFEEGDVGGVVA